MKNEELSYEDRGFTRVNEETREIYLPLGINCRPALNLVINGLRSETYPLDWMMNYSLDTVLHLFKTGFIDFYDN